VNATTPSVAVTLSEYLPVPEGVPLSVPAVDNIRPDGNPVAVQVGVELPPCDENV
jgi:hypothetical protein